MGCLLDRATLASSLSTLQPAHDSPQAAPNPRGHSRIALVPLVPWGFGLPKKDCKCGEECGVSLARTRLAVAEANPAPHSESSPGSLKPEGDALE